MRLPACRQDPGLSLRTLGETRVLEFAEAKLRPRSAASAALDQRVHVAKLPEEEPVPYLNWIKEALKYQKLGSRR